MDWLIRFYLGAPARPKDVADVGRILPEIFDRGWRPPNLHWMVAISDNICSSQELVEQLREWINNAEVPVLRDNFQSRCPAADCPMRTEAKTSADHEPETPDVLHLIIAAGGPNAKVPRDSFLNLVRRVHRQSDIPAEVILTDPYIYADVSEDGLEGGFNNLALYLEALGLNKDSQFTFTTTPSPKRGSGIALKNLHRRLRLKYEHIKFKNFSPVLRFHDRFYLVKDKSGAIKGVFGPSLNGLSSDSIVLMGDIDEMQPLKKIKSWVG